MKILVVIEHDPKKRFLVTLHDEESIAKVVGLVNRKRRSQAMVAAVSRGRFEKEVADYELPSIKADLILSEDSASWDIS